ncbi:hypothetical protein A2707_06090 [Candidatus Saccharibacteria bacterium RIFCSPHIGHO2_01_FULL_45_15]|jgi:hypothetical protein|nr:MAG: hypothetical protein A2707_06090 [Candidatus Saccharibacteria bacterium RIFCSPHIGHO2_01_FULL_45_15]OGL27559.1 MAG: hypothetical protein A3C39_04645 [Candidatus Saccharibacteria bacterium RIFCSPHIGHO2_02_FULL_46_12]OGL32029.1 MAG: hypothetical protein A3E76_02030 [Candidatus Saccharibacteria bacterium RIFCSPHIGHO2_12_FULL_44_22]
MRITDRVVATGLPLDQIVVIGSGVMDALGLRRSDDIDLVASEKLFAELKSSGDYNYFIRHNEEVLEKDDQEIWLSWDVDGVSHFTQLWNGGVTIDSVRFCHPKSVLEWKKKHNRSKDQNDIVLLQKYLDDSQ